MASGHLTAACSSTDQPANPSPGPWLTIGLAVAAGLAALAAAEYLSRRTAGPRCAGPQPQVRLSWLHLLGATSGASAAPRRAPQVEQQGGGEVDQLRGGEHAEQALFPGAGELLEVEGQEVPEEFICPITFSVMDDPVCLCGTGQVYNYTSLRAWLCTGQRKCPKTNMALVDLEVREEGGGGKLCVCVVVCGGGGGLVPRTGLLAGLLAGPLHTVLAGKQSWGRAGGPLGWIAALGFPHLHGPYTLSAHPSGSAWTRCCTVQTASLQAWEVHALTTAALLPFFLCWAGGAAATAAARCAQLAAGVLPASATAGRQPGGAHDSRPPLSRLGS